MPGEHTNRGAKRARTTREDLGLDATAPIPCTLTLAEEALGIPVNVTVLPEGVEGLCWQLGDQPMLWVGAHEFPPRRRFTLAHELGHLRCGHDDDGMILETYETINGKKTTSAETQANAFAAELLAPAAGILALVADREPTIERVVEVAAHYRVSTLSTLYRFVTVGLVPRDVELKAAYDAGEHQPLWQALGELDEPDALCRLTPEELPRLSPLLGDSALAALLRGDTSADEAAAGSSADREDLVAGLALLRL